MSALGMWGHNPWVVAKPFWVQQKNTHGFPPQGRGGKENSSALCDFFPNPKALLRFASLANHL